MPRSDHTEETCENPVKPADLPAHLIREVDLIVSLAFKASKFFSQLRSRFSQMQRTGSHVTGNSNPDVEQSTKSPVKENSRKIKSPDSSNSVVFNSRLSEKSNDGASPSTTAKSAPTSQDKEDKTTVAKQTTSSKPKIKRTWDSSMADADTLIKSEPIKKKWRRRDEDSSSPTMDNSAIESIPIPPQAVSGVPTNLNKSMNDEILQITSLSPAVVCASAGERQRSKHPRITFDSSPDRDSTLIKVNDGSQQVPGERFTFFFTKKYVFSNHYPCSFTLDGRRYNCSEQYYMYMKAKMFNDDTVADAILSYSNPKDMKNVAAAIKDFRQEKWDETAEAIMLSANWEKYTQDRNCRIALLETEGTTLVECSPNDRKWGIGLDMYNPDRLERSRWRGENILGKILTNIRETIMKDKKYADDLEEARRRRKYNRRRTY